MENINLKTYDAPPINKKEILRYAGAKEATEQTEQLMVNCLEEISDKLIYKVCWGRFPIHSNQDFTNLFFVETPSKDLKKYLKNCSEIIVFAATVGIELDRAIARYSAISPSRSHMMQAIGAERIESLCNTFCKEISKDMNSLGKSTLPRFSPGFGDLPLQIQSDIFRVLDPQRKIGVTLNGSLIMSPSKSVTAIIGIRDMKKDD